MGQIIFNGQKPKYCNLYAITSGSKVNFIPAKGEVWLVDTSVATAADVANDTKVNGVGYYDAYITGDGIKTCAQLVATALKKVDEYQKPVAGIPKTDLANDVQTSLGKADSALQSHQDISGKADKSEMSVVAGTGANADKTTITLKSGTSATVLTSHQDISGKADKSNTYTKTEVDEAIAGTGSGIETVTVAVDNNTGTPSGTASISGSTLSLNFSNLKGAKGDPGATGAQGPQGLQGIQGPEGPRGNDGNTSDSPIVIIHQVDKDTEYEPTTDVVGPDVIQNLSADDINLNSSSLIDKTVGGAFNELINGKVNFDPTGGTVVLHRKITNGSSWTGSTWGAYACCFIPISNYTGLNLIITANNTNAAIYALMTDNTSATSGTVTTFATGYTSTKTLAVGTSVVETIPNDAEYLYLQRANTGDADNISLLPSSVYIESGLRISSASIGYNEGTAKKAFDELYASREEYEKVGTEIDIDGGTNVRGEINRSWWYTGGNCTMIDISSYAGQEMTIVANNENSTYYAFVKEDTIGNSYAFVTTYAKKSTLVKIFAGETDIITIPSDACYLYLHRDSTTSSTSGDMLPSSVTIEGVELDISGGKIGTNKHITYPTWTTGGERRCSILPFPYGGRPIVIKGNETNYTAYAFLTSGETGSNNTEVSNFAKYNIVKTVNVGETVRDFVPNDTTHLYILRAHSSSTTDLSYAPTKIVVMSGLKLDAACVVFNDDYYEDSDVQTVLEDVNKELDKSRDYMDAFDTYTKGTGILDFYANKETEKKLMQLKWGLAGNNLQYTQVKNVWGDTVVPIFTLLHCSDIHNNNVTNHGANEDGVSNLNRIVEFYKHYTNYIDDAIHTGDSVYDTFGGNFPWDANNIDADVNSILNVIGNHDVQNFTSIQAVYNKFIGPFVTKWGITVPDNADTDGKCYYYKDYTSKKIRLITLFSWNLNLAGNYYKDQIDWFHDVLADALTEGLTVICAVHNVIGPMDFVEGCTFNSWEYTMHPDASSANDWGVTVGSGQNAVNYYYADEVDTFINNGGNFACWIGGHAHFDVVGTLHNHPNQLMILVENAGCTATWNSDNRYTGTLTQDCFNIMSIDTVLKRVKVMRIGSNYDSAMQHKNTFCYDYGQMKLLSCN